MGLVIDLFAGGGGASTGIEAALGRPVDIAINHDPIALKVHADNHPETVHYPTDIWSADPIKVTKGRPVDLLWASPDCTHFSVAKGGKPRKKNIRSLAWVVPRWAKAVRPTVICLENVAEFRGWGPLDQDGRPDKVKKGQTFKAWKRRLERLGYTVDDRILDASLYGAPTKRRRLFLIARCDGKPIVWPEPTHGPGKLPVHTAAECIDWSIPCPSIFERKRPLADKTLWRIAQGLKRFVIDNAAPFEVPLTTVTAAGMGHAITAATLIQTGYGEREGQAARALDIKAPLGTVVAGGVKAAAVTAFLAKHFGDRGQRPGLDPAEPLATVTASDHHSLVIGHLVKLRGTNHGAPTDAATPTITAGGNHIAEVRAFLTAFHASDFSGGHGQNLTDPMRTVTTKDRLGLVTIHGTEYQIVDIGMRMLQPHELLRAQFGRFAASYDMSAAKTKQAKVRLIGNSVSPEGAEAVVRAQFEGQTEQLEFVA